MKARALFGIAALAFAAGVATGRFTVLEPEACAARPPAASGSKYEGAPGKPAVFRSRWNRKFGGTKTLRVDIAPAACVFTFTASGEKRPAIYHYPPTEEETSNADLNFDGLAEKISESGDGRTLFKISYSFGEEYPMRGGDFETLLLLVEKDGRFAVYADLMNEGVLARNPNVLAWSDVTIDWRDKDPAVGIRRQTSSSMDADSDNLDVYADFALSTGSGEIRSLGTPYLLGKRDSTLKSYAALLEAYYDFVDDRRKGSADRWLRLLEKDNPHGYVSDGSKLPLPADFDAIAHIK